MLVELGWVEDPVRLEERRRKGENGLSGFRREGNSGHGEEKREERQLK